MLDLLIAITLSVILVLLYRIHTHNMITLQPIPQLDIKDKNNVLSVYLKNYGMGTFILDAVTYTKDGKDYDNIEATLNLDPRSYMHIHPDNSITRAVMPGEYIEIFETQLDDQSNTIETKNNIRSALSKISVTAHYHDLHNKKNSITRSLEWFGTRMQ